MKNNILLIGTGSMALDYAKVLKAMQIEFTVIGRGETSAAKFEAESGIKPITGGFKKYIDSNVVPPHTYAIIGTGTEVLMPILLHAIQAGIESVLIEKPAAISIEELLENEDVLKPYSENIYVAYNRRFYASVTEAKRLIAEDGGLLSMHFEFTEWAHKIEPLTKAAGVKENWFFANSTHVVDLAFYLAGYPINWHAYSKSGKLTWHNKTNFAGAGITEKGVLFSYISNWESAGRWGIELLTDKRRIFLKPIENIHIQKKGEITILEHPFDDSIDKQFKPGLFQQVDAFIRGNHSSLENLKEHIKFSKEIYHKMKL